MTFKLLTTVFILGLCSALHTHCTAAVPSEDTRVQPPVPAPCCVPKQWEGDIHMIQGYVRSGKPGLQNVTTRESYDFTRKMIAVEVRGIATPTKVIMDYNKMEQYTITGTTCTVGRMMNTGMLNCLPMNSTYMGSSRFGGMEGLLVDSWSIVDPILGGTGVIDITRDGCILVDEVRISPPGSQEPSLITLGVTDVTLGIKDPKVFDVPRPPCPPNPGNEKLKPVRRSGTFLFTGL
ncbi:ependymin-related protein 1-like [Branchiostoma floridae]|uniref:Ependymin-related protein 1-like n=1 Tax=Branchiostoma floridae TaxID=7739 RepID=A0A9J7M703_BRAFL|nr:ependymin-related protein 1-like [Branchiostoma floridae]